MPSNLPIDSIIPDALAPFAQIRLIVADLDGTLLDPTWSVIELIQGQIPRLRHRGVRFTIATGRAFRGITEILPRLGLTDSTPLAIYNGSLCVDAAGKHVLSSRVISSEVVSKVVEWGLHRGLPVMCYPQLVMRAAVLDEVPMGFSVRGKGSINGEPNGYNIQWYSSHHLDLIPDCLAILIDLREMGDRILDLGSITDIDEVTITQSGAKFLEIRPKGSDKGVAISEIAKRLQLPLSAVLAIGDNDNDIEMLKAVGIGVAVGNASKNLQSVATHSTPLPAAQGCLHVIRLVIDAHRYGSRVK